MSLSVEILEDRTALSAITDLLAALAPATPWHYSPSDHPTDPAAAGFNLVAVSSPAQLAQIPAGDRALVWLGKTNGIDADFQASVRPYLGDPRVFGFYLADEPNPATVPAANLKAESDWIHANDPGAKTFIVLGAGPFLPFFPNYTPENTDIDLVGLDPYPVRTWGDAYWSIPLAVVTAEMTGWSRSQMVPVYQAFGGAGTFAQPSALEVQVDLAIWGMLTPHPAFDYAYSWADWGAVGLGERADLQAFFAGHNN